MNEDGAGRDRADHDPLRGPGDLDAALDGAADPRLKFRQFLAGLSGGISETAWYFEQALPRFTSDAEGRLVVEELLDHVARLMLFAADRHDDAEVSVWTSASGPQLIVAALDSMEAVVAPARLTRSYDQLGADGTLRPDRRASTLAVICGEVRYRLLEQAAAFRRAAVPLRLVSLDALLALARGVEESTLPHAVAAALLGPSSVFADPMIALVSGAALPYRGVRS